VPAKVAAIEYDPNRSLDRAAALRRRREVVHPRAGAAAGRDDGRVRSQRGHQARQRASAREHPDRHARPQRRAEAGARGQMARSAGSGIQLVAKDQGYAVLRLPSGELRRVLLTCRATVGQVGNLDHENETGGKAGRSRWKGKRPTVRGSAMNPVDHPHGAARASRRAAAFRSLRGALPTLGKRTRKKHKESNQLIVRSRRRGKEKRK